MILAINSPSVAMSGRMSACFKPMFSLKSSLRPLLCPLFREINNYSFFHDGAICSVFQIRLKFEALLITLTVIDFSIIINNNNF